MKVQSASRVAKRVLTCPFTGAIRGVRSSGVCSSKDPTGPYQERAYWHCQSCETYYRAALDKCPLCCQRRTRGAAKSSVWVLPGDGDGEDIVLPPQPSGPDAIPVEIKQILETAIKNVLGVSHTSDEVIAVVWKALVRDMPEGEATRTLGWKPRQIKNVVQQCKDLYLEESRR